jgi:hypothetical protein
MTHHPFAKPAPRPDRQAADREALDRARAAGYGPLLAVLGEPDMFTHDGRLVAARAAAALRVGKPKLRQMIAAVQSIIGSDHDDVR